MNIHVARTLSVLTVCYSMSAIHRLVCMSVTSFRKVLKTYEAIVYVVRCALQVRAVRTSVSLSASMPRQKSSRQKVVAGALVPIRL